MGRQTVRVHLVFTHDLSEKNPKLGSCSNVKHSRTFVVKEITSPRYFFPGIPLNLMQNTLAFKVSIYIQSCP